MKKFKFEPKYLIPALYALFVICAAIAFEKTIGNIPSIGVAMQQWLTTILNILNPFVYGLFIAYFLNPAMSWIESRVFGKAKIFNAHPAFKRIMSVISTYIILIGGIIWIIAYLFPEVADSVRNLIVSTPATMYSMEAMWATYLSNNGALVDFLNVLNSTIYTNYQVKDLIEMAVQPVIRAVSAMPNMINTLILQTLSAAYGILNFVIGMIIASYMLCDKEKFVRILTKLLYILFRKKSADKLMGVAQSSNTMFKKFFMGKAVDSTIIGAMFFVIAIFMRLSYPVLLALIIGVTNMIPYFGPFIGAVPVVLIVLLTNHRMAVWTALAIFILQQFDGNILGPKILGESTGLSPIGVIFSILVGGATFGVLGMFLGVPVFAVISNIMLSLLDKKYDERIVADLSKERSDV